MSVVDPSRLEELLRELGHVGLDTRVVHGEFTRYILLNDPTEGPLVVAITGGDADVVVAAHSIQFFPQIVQLGQKVLDAANQARRPLDYLRPLAPAGVS